MIYFVARLSVLQHVKNRSWPRKESHVGGTTGDRSVDAENGEIMDRKVNCKDVQSKCAVMLS